MNKEIIAPSSVLDSTITHESIIQVASVSERIMDFFSHVQYAFEIQSMKQAVTFKSSLSFIDFTIKSFWSKYFKTRSQKKAFLRERGFDLSEMRKNGLVVFDSNKRKKDLMRKFPRRFMEGEANISVNSDMHIDVKDEKILANGKETEFSPKVKNQMYADRATSFDANDQASVYEALKNFTPDNTPELQDKIEEIKEMVRLEQIFYKRKRATWKRRKELRNVRKKGLESA